MADVDINELFDRLSTLQAAQKLPPVQSWQPQRTGNIDIRIGADGTWYHEGTAFTRHALVRLFSTILRKDPDGYCLVTPAEKLLIEVDDAPFLAVDCEVKGEGADAELLFTTNGDDYVIADAAHLLWVEGSTDSPRPYLHVRDGLNALLTRPLYYRLANLCTMDNEGYWLSSRGTRFQLG